MKTKQEQIEKMAQAMCGYCLVDKRCVLKYSAPCSEVASQDCSYKESAEELICKGYGNVSEYKAEIKQLKADFKQLETNAEILASGVRDLNKENWSLEEELKKKELEITYARNNGYGKGYDECEEYMKGKIKQAQVDVLNEAKEKLDSAPNGWAYTGYIDDLIEEIQNETR